MPRMKLWRMAALGAVPLIILAVHGRFRLIDSWESRSTFRSSLNNTEQQLEARIQTIEWIDEEMRSLARTGATLHRGPITVSSRDWPNRDVITRTHAEQAAAELAALPGSGAADTRVVLLLRDMPPRSHGRQAQWTYGSAALSNDIWNPCVVSVGERETLWRDSTGLNFPRTLGQCALAGAYGEPGPAVRDMIRRVRVRSGTPVFARSKWGVRDTEGRLIANAHDRDNYWASGLQATGLGMLNCRAGDASACRSWFFSPYASGLRGDFVWWLIQRDAPAFVAFWKASGSLEEAAQANLGAPLDQLLLQFTRDRIVVADNGPGLPDKWWMAAFWVMAPLALAASRSRRQTTSV